MPARTSLVKSASSRIDSTDEAAKGVAGGKSYAAFRVTQTSILDSLSRRVNKNPPQWEFGCPTTGTTGLKSREARVFTAP